MYRYLVQLSPWPRRSTELAFRYSLFCVSLAWKINGLEHRLLARPFAVCGEHRRYPRLQPGRAVSRPGGGGVVRGQRSQRKASSAGGGGGRGHLERTAARRGQQGHVYSFFKTILCCYHYQARTASFGSEKKKHTPMLTSFLLYDPGWSACMPTRKQ